MPANINIMENYKLYFKFQLKFILQKRKMNHFSFFVKSPQGAHQIIQFQRVSTTQRTLSEHTTKRIAHLCLLIHYSYD